MTSIGSLCTGYGGLDMAVRAVFGGDPLWWSDIDDGPIAVMERHHAGVPNLGDIKTVDWISVPRVDILTAGYPCQPFSNAGARRGTADARHLWPWIARAVGVLRPGVIVLENVAGHLRRGFDVVLADLAALGYDAVWAVVRASDVGAPHRRERLFVVAQDADGSVGGERGLSAPGQAEGGRPRSDVGGRGGASVADTGGSGLPLGQVEHHGPQQSAVERGRGEPSPERWGIFAAAIARWERTRGVAPAPTVPGVRGSQVLSPFFVEWMMGLDAGHVTATEGLSRNQQLKLLGNGVVPQQAEYAIRGLWARLSRLERAS